MLSNAKSSKMNEFIHGGKFKSIAHFRRARMAHVYGVDLRSRAERTGSRKKGDGKGVVPFWIARLLYAGLSKRASEKNRGFEL